MKLIALLLEFLREEEGQAVAVTVAGWPGQRDLQDHQEPPHDGSR